MGFLEPFRRNKGILQQFQLRCGGGGGEGVHILNVELKLTSVILTPNQIS